MRLHLRRLALVLGLQGEGQHKSPLARAAWILAVVALGMAFRGFANAAMGSGEPSPSTEPSTPPVAPADKLLGSGQLLILSAFLSGLDGGGRPEGWYELTGRAPKAAASRR
jgi:hypothetical protein